MTKLQKAGPIPLQLPGKLSRRHPLGDAAQDNHQFAGRAMGSLKRGASEGIEDASARLALIVQHRRAIPPMNAQVIGLAAPGTVQPLGMQHVQEFPVAGFIIHEINDGKVHDRSSVNRPTTRRHPYRPLSYHRQTGKTPNTIFRT
jgi:hypothetical protein